MSLLKHKDQWENLGDPVATSIMTEGFRLTFKSMPKLAYQPHPSLTLSQKTTENLKDFIPQWLERSIIREILEPTLLFFFSYVLRVSGGYDSLSSRTECNVGVSPALGRNLQV